MPTEVTNLKVSLTKHGAHKIAYLVSAFDKDEILNHLDGDYKDINIDASQTKRILSIDNNNLAPRFWNDIKQFGNEDIFDLVFFAIVFSHHELIETMIEAFKNGAIVNRGHVLEGKAYTNFARIIDDLGFAIEHTTEYVSFDITRIYYKFYLPAFIYQLLELKLGDAGWENENNLIDECIRLSWHSVFNLSQEDFRVWMSGSESFERFAIKITKPKRNFEEGIKFKEGHNEKFDGELNFEVTSKQKKQLTHNHIQNELYKILIENHPADKIGTEIKSNIGSIDLVRVSDSKYIFYEIKTSNSIKTSIRQALSQLLEYAYWNNIEGINMLVIVAPNKPTLESKKYLDKLRSKFNVPIYFQFFDLSTSKLHEIE